jgi:hypothetical protein
MRTLLTLLVTLVLPASALAGDGMPIFKTQPRDVQGYVDGTFRMGSNNGSGNEKPVHSVTLTRPF